MSSEDFSTLQRAANALWPEAILSNSGILLGLARLAARDILKKKTGRQHKYTNKRHTHRMQDPSHARTRPRTRSPAPPRPSSSQSVAEMCNHEIMNYGSFNPSL